MRTFKEFITNKAVNESQGDLISMLKKFSLIKEEPEEWVISWNIETKLYEQGYGMSEDKRILIDMTEKEFKAKSSDLEDALKSSFEDVIDTLPYFDEDNMEIFSWYAIYEVMVNKDLKKMSRKDKSDWEKGAKDMFLSKSTIDLEINGILMKNKTLKEVFRIVLD